MSDGGVRRAPLRCDPSSDEALVRATIQDLPYNGILGSAATPKRGEPSTPGEKTMPDDWTRKLEVVVPTPLTQLSATNYRHWAMRMEVHLDAQNLWDVVAGTETNRQIDRLALSAMLAVIPETSGVQLDIKKSAKENWEIIRSFHVGIDRLAQSRAQGLRREFENLTMKKEDKLSDFTDKFTRTVFELRQCGDNIRDREAVKKLFRSMPLRYDSLTLTLEQFGDMDTMSLVEAIGSLKIHEMRLAERDAREEEQALLTRALNHMKKNKPAEGQSSQGASSHMTYKKSYFQSLDEDHCGMVKFGDGSSIKFEGKGSIYVHCSDGAELKLEGVLYVPDLRANILSLGKLDDAGFKSSLSGGFLTIIDEVAGYLRR
ncbi:uncharacterized protein LOC144700313 [Wolffia australiana]